MQKDHPADTKIGSVCIYYKEFIPLIERKDLTSLKECVTTEVMFSNEKCFFTCIYKSLNENHKQVDSFCFDLNNLLNNINNGRPVCSVIVADFNPKFSKWSSGDKKNTAGLELDALTKIVGYGQLTKNPALFVNSSASCINLILSTNKSLLNDCGIDPRLYDIRHHIIIFGKVNFKIPLPPPLYRGIWDCKDANNKTIQKSIRTFNWEKFFQNKNINVEHEIYVKENT